VHEAPDAPEDPELPDAEAPEVPDAAAPETGAGAAKLPADELINPASTAPVDSSSLTAPV
jgi:hypothetical protein